MSRLVRWRRTARVWRLTARNGGRYVVHRVRRVGNKVRVTGQLIHAATDEHVWAQTYDRDLTDIFTIQSELSRQIAGALKAALSPEEKVLIARRPTTIAQAARIDGMTPAALMLLLAHAKRRSNRRAG